MPNVLLTISWKYHPNWPVGHSLTGWPSLAEARKQLQKRFSDKQFKDVRGGFKYEEAFSSDGERGTLVYTFTEAPEQGAY